MSPRLFSWKIIWIKKRGENRGCLETQRCPHKLLKQKVDAVLGRQTCQTHFLSVNGDPGAG